MILETENLILRPWLEKDAKDLYNQAKNPKIGPIANWAPHTSVEYSLNIIKTVFSKKETYAITLKDDIPVGCIGLLIYPDGNYYWGEGCGEIGYWIGEKYWGRGLVVEGLEIIIKRAFNELNLNEIYATYNSANIQSERVLEKLGFEYFDKRINTDYLGENFREIAVVLKKF